MIVSFNIQLIQLDHLKQIQNHFVPFQAPYTIIVRDGQFQREGRTMLVRDGHALPQHYH